MKLELLWLTTGLLSQTPSTGQRLQLLSAAPEWLRVFGLPQNASLKEPALGIPRSQREDSWISRLLHIVDPLRNLLLRRLPAVRHISKDAFLLCSAASLCFQRFTHLLSNTLSVRMAGQHLGISSGGRAGGRRSGVTGASPRSHPGPPLPEVLLPPSARAPAQCLPACRHVQTRHPEPKPNELPKPKIPKTLNPKNPKL